MASVSQLGYLGIGVSHMNDHMFSFYMANPSGFGLEYGWNGRTLDDATRHAEHYTSVQSIWGHPQLQDVVNSMAPAKK